MNGLSALGANVFQGYRFGDAVRIRLTLDKILVVFIVVIEDKGSLVVLGGFRIVDQDVFNMDVFGLSMMVRAVCFACVMQK